MLLSTSCTQKYDEAVQVVARSSRVDVPSAKFLDREVTRNGYVGPIRLYHVICVCCCGGGAGGDGDGSFSCLVFVAIFNFLPRVAIAVFSVLLSQVAVVVV